MTQTEAQGEMKGKKVSPRKAWTQGKKVTGAESTEAFQVLAWGLEGRGRFGFPSGDGFLRGAWGRTKGHGEGAGREKPHWEARGQLTSRGWECRQQVKRGSRVKAKSKEGLWYCPDLWTEGQRACVCVCMCPQVCRVGTQPREHGDREACLHRGEEQVLVGLAAHGPPSVGCRRGRGGALHTLLLKPCHSTRDPRGTSGKSGRPQGGGGG